MKRLSVAIFGCLFIACSAGPFGPSRKWAIETAIKQVKETMAIALPDLDHPEPYRYEDAGDCALVPGMTSSRETLRYQVQVHLPHGDDGLDRQANAIKYWVDKGAAIRTLSYDTGRPPAEVEYNGGSILAFAMPRRDRSGATGESSFYIVATTPCIPKQE